MQKSAHKARSEGRQKRYHKRSPRACDECRLRKCKCDGFHPCGPCKATSHDCTYDPHSTPMQKPTQKVRELESRLRAMRALIQEAQVKASCDGAEALAPTFQALQEYLKPTSSSVPASPVTQPASPRSDDGFGQKLTSMMKVPGRMVNAREASTAFYGPMSGLSFVCRTLELFQPGSEHHLEAVDHIAHTTATNLFDASLPDRRILGHTRTLGDRLPERAAAIELLDAALVQCEPLSRLLHEHDFRILAMQLCDQSVQRNLDSEQYAMLPLLHTVLGLGYLFNPKWHQSQGCGLAVGEATRHFLIANDNFDVLQSPTLLYVQTSICLAIFLIGTSRLGRAHHYVGTACSAALRLGLHLMSDDEPTGAHRTMKMKIFTVVLELDTYLSVVLDLLQFINHEYLNLLSFMPEVDESLSQLPDDPDSDDIVEMEMSKRHADLMVMLIKALRIVFHDKTATIQPSNAAGQIPFIDPKVVREADAGFHTWLKRVRPLLVRVQHASHPKFMYLRHKLETTFYLSQLVLHFPFLHYLTPIANSRSEYAMQPQFALSCIKVASTTISRFSRSLDSGTLIPADWNTVYIVFLSVLSLVFLIAAHKGKSRPGEAWRRAESGIKILSSMRCMDDGANASLIVLRLLMKKLKHTVDLDIEQICSHARPVCQEIGKAIPWTPLSDMTMNQQGLGSTQIRTMFGITANAKTASSTHTSSPTNDVGDADLHKSFVLHDLFAHNPVALTESPSLSPSSTKNPRPPQDFPQHAALPFAMADSRFGSSGPGAYFNSLTLGIPNEPPRSNFWTTVSGTSPDINSHTSTMQTKVASTSDNSNTAMLPPISPPHQHQNLSNPSTSTTLDTLPPHLFNADHILAQAQGSAQLGDFDLFLDL